MPDPSRAEQRRGASAPGPRLASMLAYLLRPEGLRGSYLPDLEGLRGVAIVLVVAYHFESCILATQPGVWVSPLHAFISAGHTGVSLFFLLSAFLLSRPFLAEAAGGRPVVLSSYYASRALRILPLYDAAVLIATVLCAHGFGDLRHALPPLFFLNHFQASNPLFPYSAVWWSLATEVQFYLLLPLLPLVVRSRAGALLGAALLAVWMIAYAALLSGRIFWSQGYFFLSFGLVGRAPIFAIGILLAWLHARRRGPAHPLLARGGGDALLVAVLFALGMLLRQVSYLGWSDADARYPWWHVIEGLLWGAVLWLVLTTPLRLRPLLSNPALWFLGVISYSIYIVHYPLIDLTIHALRGEDRLTYLGWSANAALVGVVLALVCIVLSTLSYLVIERPFLARKRRLRA